MFTMGHSSRTKVIIGLKNGAIDRPLDESSYGSLRCGV